MTDPARRSFLRRAVAAAVAMGAARLGLAQPTVGAPSTTRPADPPADASTQPHDESPPPSPPPMDRRAIVSRHNPRLSAVDLLAPLQVGNGEFAMTCDVTGLQTLADAHREKTPLNTMAQWAWHSAPNREGYRLESLIESHELGRRQVPYYTGVTPPPAATRPATAPSTAPSTAPIPASRPAGERPADATVSAAAEFFRNNPHRVALGRIAFVAGDGTPIGADELSAIEQTLDLWTGLLASRFTYKGQVVSVRTAAHPTLNLVVVEVAAPELFAAGELAVQVRFPAADRDSAGRHPDGWDRPDDHATVLRQLDTGWLFERTQDDFQSFVRLRCEGDGATLRQTGDHAYTLGGLAGEARLAVEFSPRPFDAPLVPVADVFDATTKHWASFWGEGAAIDFGACTDVRASELERRVVLSQYLTAVNCAGSVPPQESGLAFNTAAGKPNMELHWAAAAHFAMWGRYPHLERSLAFYRAILPQAQAAAKRQGYDGARWPRRTGPDGLETPDAKGPLAIWHQPHPIYFAELAYRAQPTRETLERYATLVEETARFMAGYPVSDSRTRRVTLGPLLVSAQDLDTPAPPRPTSNPTFELAYWAWGLRVAQKWRDRLGQPPEERWTRVIDRLARPAVRDGRYAATENEPGIENVGHPSFLMALGFVPRTHLIDEAIMRETARWTKSKWKWSDAAGWDFATLAQAATRTGDAELAVDALLLESEKNRYLPNGHHLDSDTQTVSLSANGALLAAIALMAGGWEEGPDEDAPGFPKNGKWNVRCEGFGKVV